MRKLLIGILALCLCIGCLPADAYAGFWGGGGEKGLPKTGQTTEYQSGDDGTYMKGLPSSGDRFTDNNDGTITDNATGLQWVKQPELIIPGAVGVHSSNQIQAAMSTWANGTSYSLADLTIDSSDSTYWVCAVAHTSLAGSSGSWATETLYTVGTIITDGDDSSVWICAVENTSGTTTMSDDRTANPTYWTSYDPSFSADRTAHPTYWRQTVWTSSADGLTSPAYMDWSTAIVSCEALEYAGHSDWRLPNIKELQSIVDYSTYSPAINGTFFPNGQSDGYWSGTTYACYSGGAWVVYFGDGYVNYGDKYYAYDVRPVRSSQ